MSRTTRRLAAAVVAVASFGAATSTAAPLTLVGRMRLDTRLSQLAFRTPAVAKTTGVRVLLPAGYGARARRRYPVLYLLHGALDDDTAWTVKGAAELLTARYPLIVVMPDSGTSGGYTDWYNGGRGGPPEWETYHIDQLIPWVDAHYRTVARRSGRAIAGLSMGGFGAISYAARRPDLFAAAASFSGALDTNNPLDIAVTGDQVFGPRTSEEVRWRAHNPWDLAQNLRGMSLTIRTGNGMAGGPYGPSVGSDIVELAVHQMSVSFHDRLVRLGIGSIWDDYGPGGHRWPYWDRDLRQTLPTFMAVFAHPRPVQSAFDFTAVEPRYGVYGWSVVLTRRVLEFSTLHVVRPRVFTLTGSGRATVRTAPVARPHAALIADVRDAHGAHRHPVVADGAGRLTLTLALGPSNRDQQFTPGARSRRSVTGSVRIEGRG